MNDLHANSVYPVIAGDQFATECSRSQTTNMVRHARIVECHQRVGARFDGLRTVTLRGCARRS